MSLNSLQGEPRTDFEELVKEDLAHQTDFPVRKLLRTVPETERVLAISRSKMYNLLNSGLLPSVHIGRARRS